MFIPLKTNLPIALLASLVPLGFGSAAYAQDDFFEWYSEGTFDFDNLPGQSGMNTFSSSLPFDFTEVRFYSGALQGPPMEGWPVVDVTFDITAANGDRLEGYLFPDIFFNDVDMDGNYNADSVFIITGGTGLFTGADGGGLLIGTAQFTSPTSATVDYYWEGSITLVPEPSTVLLTGFPLAFTLVGRRHRLDPPTARPTNMLPSWSRPLRRESNTKKSTSN
jgi:hypothetical protein